MEFMTDLIKDIKYTMKNKCYFKKKTSRFLGLQIPSETEREKKKSFIKKPILSGHNQLQVLGNQK